MAKRKDTKVAEKPAETPETPETEEKKERVAYMTVADASILNDEGQLTQVPEDFDGSEHLTPRKADFANEADYLEFKAVQADLRITHLAAQAEKWRKEAEHIRQFGDPEQRAKVLKAQRLKDQYAALRSQLEEEGLDVDEILGGDESDEG